MRNVIFIALLSFSFSNIIHVPDDYPTIQEGIDASTESDTVLVLDGEYFENLYLNKDITIASYYITDGDLNHRDNTIINGSNASDDAEYGSCLLITGDEIYPVVQGFTFTGGKGTVTNEEIDTPDGLETIHKRRGGGVTVYQSNATVTYNRFYNNGYIETEDINGGGAASFIGTGVGVGRETPRDINRDWVVDFSHNIYDDNSADQGSTFLSWHYNGDIDMSNCYYDVYNCEEEEVTLYWVYTDSTIFDFEEGDGELCLNPDLANVYVAPEGDDWSNDGTQDYPLRTIDKAFSIIAPDSDNIVTVNLDEGTYAPSTTGQDYPIYMVSYINLIGAGEEVTILDAEADSLNQRRVITMENVEGVTISDLTITGGSGDGTSGGGMYLYDSDAILANIIIENSERYGCRILLSNVTLNNIIIKENYSYGENWSHGIYIGSGSTVHISNSEISNHTSTSDYSYGAGMIINDAEVIMENIVISNNVCTGMYNGVFEDEGGGAVSISDGAYVEIINLTMSDNIGNRNGGGIDVLNSTINISNSTFGNNITQFGSNDHGGGGISVRNSDANIISCNFSSNISSRSGGAILIQNSNIELSDITINENESQYGGGISIIDTSICNMQNVDIMNNDSFVGGGIYIKDSYINILYGKVNFNTATYTNGIRMYSSNGNIREVEILSNSIYLEDSNPLMENILLQNYSVTPIYCHYSNPIIKNSIISDNSGGAIILQSSNPIIINTTFSNNTGGSMGGNAPILLQYSNPIFINSIIWDSDTTSFWDSYCLSSIITFINSLFDESEWALNQSSWYDNGLNINVDPLFTDSGTGDYTIQEDSPCIDAGTAFFEWEGDTLINLPDSAYYGLAPDMGAFEWMAEILGDLNEDGLTNIQDIVIEVDIILENIIPIDYQLWAGDLNADGAIDIYDIILLVGIILY